MFESQEPTQKAEHLRHTRVKLAPGQTVRAWKSGPHCGIATHYPGQTKPCHSRITTDALECRYCKAEMALGWTGYLPYFDETGRKMVVLFGRDMKDAVSQIPFGAAIKISKGKWQAAPVIITENQWSVIPCPYLGRLRCQQDIRPWLLNLWGEKELCEYFGLVPQEIPLPEKPKPVPKARFPKEALPPKLGERFRQTAPSTNGTHQHSDEE
jgi:hypothetical protein